MPTIEPFAIDTLRALGPNWVVAIEAAPVPGLGDTPRCDVLAKMLADAGSNSGPSHLTSHAWNLCRSGLWLLAGDLDRSHAISQDDPSAEGSFWHGIMHRREGDFGNANYWFRKAGEHPAMELTADRSGGVYGDAYSFNDACRDAVESGSDNAQECIRAQWIEWQTLMCHCVSL